MKSIYQLYAFFPIYFLVIPIVLFLTLWGSTEISPGYIFIFALTALGVGEIPFLIVLFYKLQSHFTNLYLTVEQIKSSKPIESANLDRCLKLLYRTPRIFTNLTLVHAVLLPLLFLGETAALGLNMNLFQQIQTVLASILSVGITFYLFIYLLIRFMNGPLVHIKNYNLDHVLPSSYKSIDLRQKIIFSSIILPLLSAGIIGLVTFNQLYKDAGFDAMLSGIFLYLFLVIIVAGLGMTGGYLLYKDILVPVLKLKEFTTHIADGNLNSKLYLATADELGVLAMQVIRMRRNLKNVLERIQVTFNHLQQAASDLKSGSGALFDTNNQIASSLEELAAAVEEITASIRSVADASNDQAQISKKSDTSLVKLAEEMSRAAGLAREAMGKSEQALKLAGTGERSVETLTKHMQTIAESANRIMDIISVINDITDQTNLLSLNASIEAARAGEQGRGFAVVASEVSKLADKSSKNAKEIDSIIRKTVSQIAQAVKTTEEAEKLFDSIVENVNQTTKDAEKTAESIEARARDGAAISDQLRLLNQKSQSISLSTAEQSANSDEIARGIQGLNAMTQDSSGMAEKVARLADDLEKRAHELGALLQEFTVAHKTSSR